MRRNVELIVGHGDFFEQTAEVGPTKGAKLKLGNPSEGSSYDMTRREHSLLSPSTGAVLKVFRCLVYSSGMRPFQAILL